MTLIDIERIQLVRNLNSDLLRARCDRQEAIAKYGPGSVMEQKLSEVYDTYISTLQDLLAAANL